MRYRTVAHWPRTVTGLADAENRSFDIHDTREQAEGVANLLRREGFGGDSKIFPLAVEIEELEDSRLGFREQFNWCHDNKVCQLGEAITETAVRYYVEDDTAEGGIRTHWGPKNFTARPYLCGKFGGICSSGNLQCIMMRGGDPTPADSLDHWLEELHLARPWWKRFYNYITLNYDSIS